MLIESKNDALVLHLKMDLAHLYCYNCDHRLSVNLAFCAKNGQQIFRFLADFWPQKIYNPDDEEL